MTRVNLSALERNLIDSRKEEMVFYIQSNPNVFKELIELAISKKQPYSWRAAWLLWSCMKKNDSRLQEHVATIIERLDTFEDGHQRNLINVLQRMEINEEYYAKLFDSCVAIWKSIDKQSSVRFRAFEFLLEITKSYPELYNEVIVLCDDKYMNSLSQGIKKSTMKILHRFEKSLSMRTNL